MNQLINKYKNIPAPVKASLWYTICSTIQQGISFLTVMIFTRMMSTEEYGLTNIYQTWFNIIIIFATLNLQYGAFNNAMLKFENDRDRYISSMQGLTTLLTLSLFAVYFIFRAPINNMIQMTTPVMLAMCIELLVTPAFGFWSGKKRFDYEYKMLVIITIIISIVTPLLGIVMVYNSDEKGVARIYSLVIVKAIVYGGLYVYNGIKGKAFFDKEYWKYAIGFNGPLVPYYLSQIVFNQSDRIMIDNMTGRDDAAIYGVAFSIALVLTFVLNAINNSFVPWKYRKFKEKEYEGVGQVSNGIALLMAGMLLALILCAPEIIRIMGPEEYSAAKWVVPPLAAGVYFLFIAQLFINVEFFFEEKTMLVAGSIFSAVLNIVLNAIFIKIYGFVAAGYTSLVCYIMFAVCNYFCIRKTLKKHWPEAKATQIYDLKTLIIMSIVFLALMFGCIVLYNTFVIRYVILVIAIIVAIINRNKIIDLVKKIKG